MIQLFTTVFEQLPSVMEDVAPNGWEQSPYYPLFHFSPEEAMLLALRSKLGRVQYEERFGVLRHKYTKSITVEALFEDFDYEHREETVKPELELCAMFAEALRQICIGGKFVDDNSKNLYEVNPPVADMAALIAARDTGILNETPPFRLPHVLWDKRELITEVNTIPLMRHLFQAMKTTAFHWEYMDFEALEFIDYCAKFEAGEIDDPSPYYANDHDERLGISSTPKVDDLFKETDKELPAAAVVAYADAFGDWPKGFPLEKDHYLAWYDSLKRG